MASQRPDVAKARDGRAGLDGRHLIRRITLRSCAIEPGPLSPQAGLQALLQAGVTTGTALGGDAALIVLRTAIRRAGVRLG